MEEVGDQAELEAILQVDKRNTQGGGYHKKAIVSLGERKHRFGATYGENAEY